MFGTPVAAALALSEMAAASPRPLWDRIFGPLVAAAAGSITMLALSAESMVLTIDSYPQPAFIDLFTGGRSRPGPRRSRCSRSTRSRALHAAVQAPRLAARRARPSAASSSGVLGAIGGPLTMFKGLDQMKELTDTRATTAPCSWARCS